MSKTIFVVSFGLLPAVQCHAQSFQQLQLSEGRTSDVLQDKATPSHGLKLVAQLNIGPQQGESLTIVGTWAFVGTLRRRDAEADVKIIDIANPAKPTLIGRWESGGANVAALAVVGKHAYVGRTGGGSVILDISDPSMPAVTGTRGLPHSITELIVQDKQLFALAWNGLHVFTIGDAGRIATMSVFPVEQVDSNKLMFRDVAIAGRTVYLAWHDMRSDEAGLEVMRMQDDGKLESVTRLTRAKNANNYSMAMALNGERLLLTYVETDKRLDYVLDIFDVSRPAAPKVLQTLPIERGGRGILIVDGTAYVAGLTSLVALGISEPGHARQLGKVDGVSHPTALYATVDHLFIVTRQALLVYSRRSD